MSHSSSTCAHSGQSRHRGELIAAIYRNDFKLELRIELASELMHSQLSRNGEHALLLRAERVKTDLMEQGSIEPLNAKE